VSLSNSSRLTWSSRFWRAAARVRFDRGKGLVAVLSLGLGACATVRPGRSGVDELFRQRSGQRMYWNTGTAADSQVVTRVAGLLQDTLTPDAAVQVALLDNEGLQATYEDLGIAQADLVQAGLLRNPIFSFSRRTSSGDVPSAVPNIQFGVVQSFLDLFQGPLRRRVARAQFAATQARVANAALDLSASVRAGFFSLQGAEQLVDLRRTTLRATYGSYQAARAIHAAGNIPDVDLTNERALYEQSRVDLEQALADAALARERLTALMGLPRADSTWRVANRLPPVPAADPSSSGLEVLAIRQRLDLSASTQDIEAAARAGGLSRGIAFLQDGTIGFDGERDIDGKWVRGPVASISVPLFDQGQAGRSLQHSRLRQTIERHNALVASVGSQVRVAQATLRAARIREAYYRAVIVPLRYRAVEETQRQFNAMTVGVFNLLLAKQAEIEAGRSLVEAQRDYWVARANLERAAGGSVPDSLFTEASSPVTPADTAQDIVRIDSTPMNAMPMDSSAKSTTMLHGSTRMPGMSMPAKARAKKVARPGAPAKLKKAKADTTHVMSPTMKMPR
jgi:cobalt-zinc-cadmium efflux system outer membrane protein